MDNLTLLTIIGSSFSFIIILIKTIHKSKCRNVECCCFKIIRDIEIEKAEHEFDIKNNVKDNDIENLKKSIY